MKKSALIGTLALLSTLFLVNDSFACGRGRGGCACGGKGMGPGRGAAMAGLDLSEAQQARIDELRAAHQKTVAPIREQLQEKRSQMQALWKAEHPDREAIANLQAEMDPLRIQLREARTEHRLAVHEVLTAEQRQKLQKRMGKGKRGGFGPGAAGCPGMGGGCQGGCGGGFGGPGN